MVPVGDGGFFFVTFFDAFLAAFLTAFLTAFLAGFFMAMRDSPLYRRFAREGYQIILNLLQ